MYGSNLDPGRLSHRAPSWDGRFQVACLHHHELQFHKRSINYRVAANVTPHPTRQVWGITIALNSTDLMAMDRFESCHESPPHYCRTPITVQSPTSPLTWQVETYIAQPEWIEAGLKPTANYLNYILTGAAHYDFPSDYIAAIARLGRIS